MRAAAAEGDVNAARDFLRFFRDETVEHFREEEERLFPLVADSQEARGPLVRVLLEHQRLYALVTRLAGEVEDGAPTSVLMSELGELLEQHIRFEERQLFPLIERLVPDLEQLSPPERDDESAVTTVDLSRVAGEGPAWGAASEDLNATLLVWPAGHEVARHVNEERDVLIVVLAGSADVTVGLGTDTLHAGQATLVPKGEPRAIVAGDEGVRYLSVHRRRPPLQIAAVSRRG